MTRDGRLTWEMIGGTGEWAGGVGVVATLFYLARQIHQQNTIAKSEVTQNILSEAAVSVQIAYENGQMRRQDYDDYLKDPGATIQNIPAAQNGRFGKPDITGSGLLPANFSHLDA